jgi:WD40 repeat protein
VYAVCTVPQSDGTTLLASAGDDATVRVWDPATGTQLGPPLTGHTGPVWAVCAVPRPDGITLLASAGGDTTVLVWELSALSAG